MGTWEPSVRTAAQNPRHQDSYSEEDPDDDRTEYASTQTKRSYKGSEEEALESAYDADESRSLQELRRPKGKIKDPKGKQKLTTKMDYPRNDTSKTREKLTDWDNLDESSEEDSQSASREKQPRLMRTDDRDSQLDGRSDMRKLERGISRMGRTSSSQPSQSPRNVKVPFLKQFAGNPDQLQEFEMKFRTYAAIMKFSREEACQLVGSYLTDDAARWFMKIPSEKKQSLDQLFMELKNKFSPEQRKRLLTQEAMEL